MVKKIVKLNRIKNKWSQNLSYLGRVIRRKEKKSKEKKWTSKKQKYKFTQNQRQIFGKSKDNEKWRVEQKRKNKKINLKMNEIKTRKKEIRKNKK